MMLWLELSQPHQETSVRVTQDYKNRSSLKRKRLLNGIGYLMFQVFRYSSLCEI